MPRERRIGIRALRARLAQVLNDLAGGGEPYIVERHGEPVAALVPVDLYRRLAPPDTERVGAGRVGEPVRGPYDALLALAGAMPGEGADVPGPKTKLTVTIDRNVLPRAKKYARAKGISLSSLIESSLRSVGRAEEPSFSARWRGAFKPANRRDPRYKALAGKYL